MCALYSGDRPPHQHNCVLGVGKEGIAGYELCSLLSGIITDSPFHWVQRGVHRVAVHLSMGKGEGEGERREGEREKRRRERGERGKGERWRGTKGEGIEKRGRGIEGGGGE